MPTSGDDHRPKYQRIAESLREAIQSGRYGPGDRLPGENELMAKFGVASMTARHALSVLKEEGLTESRKGAGVFVLTTQPVTHPQSTSPPLHSVSVAGIVVREDGRVLVIRRADNGSGNRREGCSNWPNPRRAESAARSTKRPV